MSDQDKNVPELLARLDERTRSISSEISSLKTDQRDRMDNISKNIKDVVDSNEKKLTKVEQNLEDLETTFNTVLKDYVKKESFDLIRNIVLAVAGLILTSFFVAVIRLVITTSSQ